MDNTGAHLRAEREAAGLTQQAVADALGVRRETVIAWESRALVRDVRATEYLRGVRELASRKQEQPE